jgi:ribose 5-phosphate isomerase
VKEGNHHALQEYILKYNGRLYFCMTKEDEHMSCFKLMAVAVNHRAKNAAEVQGVLTKYGCLITVRLGLHEGGNVCSDSGLIILQLSGTSEETESFAGDLNSIPGVNAKFIEICTE